MSKYITNQIMEEAIKDLQELVAQPSYNQSPAPKAPFGKGIHLALNQMMALCDRLGMHTYEDPEGYYGYAEIGEGKEIFGVIGHLDTVPAGDLTSWSTAPFTPLIKDGFIYGRGTQDDKGPTIAALFALKSLLDAGLVPTKRIRFIFGTDEEILWRGIAKYNEKEAPIDMGFSPDAEFPLTYAEKGLQQSYLVGPGTDQFSLHMDNAMNAVPAKADYAGPRLTEVKAALDQHGFKYKDYGNSITVLGKSVHAMNAPQGVNAVLRLCIALDDVFDFLPLDLIGKCFLEDATGENLLGRVADESGHLTFNISSFEVNEKETRLQIDMRVPVTVDHDKLIKRLSQKVKAFDLTYEHFDYLAPLFVSKESRLVKTLMKVYQDVTGDTNAKPQISGGATFARTMHNCVAFGGMLPGVPDYMHQANEQWSLSSMAKTMEIYAEALRLLCFE